MSRQRSRGTRKALFWVVLLLALLVLLLRSILRFSSTRIIIYGDYDGIERPLNTSTSIKQQDKGSSSKNIKQQQQTPPPRVIVSMTTIPERLAHIEPTLKSLLDNQTVPIYKLFLSLPQKSWIFENRTIHYQEEEDFLSHYSAHHQLQILRPTYDYGPVDKILHVVEYIQDNADICDDVDCKLIYLDDDVIYHETIVETLLRHSTSNHAIIAFSGAKLRSNFRKIAHGRPIIDKDCHPNLYFWLSGDTFDSSSAMRVDIVQGFTGVLVPHTIIHTVFATNEFTQFVQETTHISNIWKADDWIISGFLEYHNISRFVVGGMHNPLQINTRMKRNLARTMHVQTMEAAYYLQQRLGIWQQCTFVDYQSLNTTTRAWMDCESNIRMCGMNTTRSRQELQKRATELLDRELLGNG